MITINQIIEKIRAEQPEINISRVQESFEYARHHLRGMYRLTGDPMLIHALMVTNNLLAFKPDENSILAALLHDVSKASTYDPVDLSNKFGSDVGSLIVGMEKLQAIHLKGGKSDLEAFRRMFLSLASDLRLVLIRLADLLHDIESLGYVPQVRRKEVAREMLDAYAPIASRLGIYSVKFRLEDLAFKYLYPDKFENLASLLEDYVRKQEKFVENIEKKLTDLLEQNGIQARVEGRKKNLYSIYRKMRRKSKASLDGIYDVFAFRIILPTRYHKNGIENTERLYTLLGLIHSQWSALPRRFKDYVAVPKPNGYRSLHTTLVDNERPFEVQIRSENMHQQAEFGFAAHWLYSDTKGVTMKLDYKSDNYQEWLNGLVSLQSELVGDEKLSSDSAKLQMFQGHIFVFTPDGEVKDLPSGSTPIDFAYSVHTDIGHKCNGAKVNGSIVPLDYQLKNGDRVEILTNSKADPKPHWLSFVRSAQAKSKIKNFFKGLDNEQSFKDGKDIVNKYLVGLGKAPLDDTLSVFRKYGQQKLSLKEREALVEEIGNGSVTVSMVFKKVFMSPSTSTVKQKKTSQSGALKLPGNSSVSDEILIAGEKNVPFKLSSCCKPQSGDAVVAYVTRGNVVRVHLQSCKLLSKGNPARILEASWGYQVHQPRLISVSVNLKAIDRVGLLRDIASTIASFNVNILDLSLKERRDNLIHRHMVLEVQSLDQYEKIMQRLRQVRNVLEVSSLEDERAGF